MYPVKSEVITYTCTQYKIDQHKPNNVDIDVPSGSDADYYRECTICGMLDWYSTYWYDDDGDGLETGHDMWHSETVFGRDDGWVDISEDRYPKWVHAGSTRYYYMDKDGKRHDAFGASVNVTEYYYMDYSGTMHSTTQTGGSINGGTYYDVPSLSSVQSAKLTAKSLDGGNLPVNTAGKYIYVGRPD